jgi:hypothetical protein
MEKVFQYYIVNREGKLLAGPFDCRRDAEECMPPESVLRIGRFEVTSSKVVEVR